MFAKIAFAFLATAVAQSCAGVKCGDISCPAPFKMKKSGTCCPTCVDVDNVVDTGSNYRDEQLTDKHMMGQCPNADSKCRTTLKVECFELQCGSGETQVCSGDDCCPKCKADLLFIQTSNTTADSVAAAVEAQRQTPKIHDHWSRLAAGDHAQFLQVRETPDVSDEVARERAETPHIVGDFQALEDADPEVSYSENYVRRHAWNELTAKERVKHDAEKKAGRDARAAARKNLLGKQ